jgi:polyhydroxyalkanoate synthesis regulator phasin
MTTSAQLELEAEETRSQIAETLDELRDRMTPGQIVDQVIDYMRDSGGGMFMQNFRQQVVANPIPVTLVGAGIAWLAMASRRRGNGSIGRTTGGVGNTGSETWPARDHASDVAEGWSDSARETASDWAEQSSAAASRLGDLASEAGGRIKGSANAAASAVNDAASATYDAAARGSRRGADLLGRTATNLRDNVASGGRSFTDLVKDQPLVLAGLGLALGALLGAVLPGTETEDQLMGDASDTTKSEAQGFAEQQVEKGKAAAEEGWNAVDRALDQHQSDSGRAEHTATRDPALAAQNSEVPLVPSSESRPDETVSDGVRGEREHTR